MKDTLYNKMTILIEGESAGQLVSCLERIIKDIWNLSNESRSYFFHQKENIERIHGRAFYSWTITKQDIKGEMVEFKPKEPDED